MLIDAIMFCVIPFLGETLQSLFIDVDVSVIDIGFEVTQPNM